MTTEQLREWHQAQPFRPFRIHMANGRAVDVNHPESLARSGSGRTIAVWAVDKEAFETIDLLLVSSLEPLEIGSKRRRNGK